MKVLCSISFPERTIFSNRHGFANKLEKLLMNVIYYVGKKLNFLLILVIKFNQVSVLEFLFFVCQMIWFEGGKDGEVEE